MLFIFIDYFYECLLRDVQPVRSTGICTCFNTVPALPLLHFVAFASSWIISSFFKPRGPKWRSGSTDPVQGRRHSNSKRINIFIAIIDIPGGREGVWSSSLLWFRILTTVCFVFCCFVLFHFFCWIYYKCVFVCLFD